MGLSCFRDKWQFQPKIANFSDPVFLMSLLREFPLEFCYGDSAKNTVVPLPEGGNSMMIYAFI